MEKDKKQLKKEYQQDRRPMGVFLIRNLVSNKVFLGSGQDINGIMNRHRFELTSRMHMNRRLQSDWNKFGETNFAFEILDQLVTSLDSRLDDRDELAYLEKLWLEKLQPFDDRGYNEREVGRDEKLRRIAANRLDHDQGES